MKEARTEAVKAIGIKPLPIFLAAAIVALMIGFSTIVSTQSKDQPAVQTGSLFN